MHVHCNALKFAIVHDKKTAWSIHHTVAVDLLTAWTQQNNLKIIITGDVKE